MQKDCRIHAAGAVANIEEVVVRVLMNRECAVRAQLPEAGDSGSDLQPWTMLANVTLDEKRHLRPRPNERHLPQEHIEKLRRLVQSCAAKHSAYPGDARIGWLDGRGFVHRRAGAHSR